MNNNRIMYVCTLCADEAPEGCGHYDPKDLAVMPNGDWLCHNCYDDLPFSSKILGQDEEAVSFSDLPHPPKYEAQP